MGRVSKYKKIKSCDPFSKKNKGKSGGGDLVGVWGLGDNGRKHKKRSRTAEKLKAAKNKKNKKNATNNSNGLFDLPPTDGDEFDLSDLMGSVKKQKLETNNLLHDDVKITSTTIKSSTVTTTNIPITDQEESKVARLLKLENQITQKQEQKKLESHKRMEGESKRAYAKRTKAETRQIIKQTSVKRNLEKIQRKKEFMNNKKKQKKRGGTSVPSDDSEDDYGRTTSTNNDDGGIITGERAVAAMAADTVKFGEQAERPPIFRQLPRGAKSSSSSSSKSMSNQQNTSEPMSEAQISAESNAMEMIRRRVQAQYAAVRSRRRQAGESFHL
jgi:hypothetical protein